MQILGEGLIPAEAYRAHLRLQLKGRNSLRRLIAGVLTVVALSEFWEGGGISRSVFGTDWVWGAGAMIVLAGVYGVVWPWYEVSAVMKQLAPLLGGPWQYDINDNGLVVTTPLVSTFVPWRSVRRIEEHPQFWMVHIALKGGSYLVFKAPFSPAAQEAVRAVVSQPLSGGQQPIR